MDKPNGLIEQVHRSTDTTPFDLVLTRPSSSLALPGTVLQENVSILENPRIPAQYKRATIRKLRNALERAKMKLTAAQRHYKTDSDRKVRFSPVTGLNRIDQVSHHDHGGRGGRPGLCGPSTATVDQHRTERPTQRQRRALLQALTEN